MVAPAKADELSEIIGLESCKHNCCSGMPVISNIRQKFIDDGKFTKIKSI